MSGEGRGKGKEEEGPAGRELKWGPASSVMGSGTNSRFSSRSRAAWFVVIFTSLHFSFGLQNGLVRT